MRKGYSLIEILIVVSIIGIMTVLGTISYREFSRKQNVVTAASLARSTLSLAQSRALSGEKPPGCSGDLDGFSVRMFGSPPTSSFIVEAQCDSAVVVESIPIPSNVTVSSFSPITFRSVQGGTNISASNVTFTISTSGSSYTENVVVESSGNIH